MVARVITSGVKSGDDSRRPQLGETTAKKKERFVLLKKGGPEQYSFRGPRIPSYAPAGGTEGTGICGETK